MQNTDFSHFCDEQNRTRIVNILGTDVRVKSYICSQDGIVYPEKPENVQLQLSVCPTSFCPASCPFCIAVNTKTHQTLDLNHFEKTMVLLKNENRIRGVKITGGEPFYDISLLNEVVSILFDVFGLDFEISISTNGIGFDKLHNIRNLEKIEAIHLSRHHYDDDINRLLFGGMNVPSGAQLKEVMKTVSFKDIFVMNCMLLRDYINSPEEAHSFLDFAISTGTSKVGFMTCTPINDYAREQHIPFECVINDNDPSLLFTRQFSDYEFCHCRDGIYVSSSGDLIEFYGRSTNANGCRYSRGLVYDADNHLRDGFCGTIIV